MEAQQRRTNIVRQVNVPYREVDLSRSVLILQLFHNIFGTNQTNPTNWIESENADTCFSVIFYHYCQFNFCRSLL